MPSPAWSTGDYLTHRFNPELGIGRITAMEGRTLVVEFPRSGTTLRLARTTDALLPIELSRGRPVRLAESGEQSTIAESFPDGTLRLATGRVVRARVVAAANSSARCSNGSRSVTWTTAEISWCV